MWNFPQAPVSGAPERAPVDTLDKVGDEAASIVEAIAVSDPPFPALIQLDEDEVI